ncbi:FUSC family protein [Tessaracoccus antarcticus]|uniref:Aromatic acid exporter family protein n=1 Tax=Tessaracoccus antarcticus TaxID=2479848 RepID=A0A3M0G1S3_9ACTN|nr:FUSC family protein [Tessaracoccus antarcticus]RMB58874.1 aromatic acid exporter family protein [Tessaracoccus antarcticus]
MSKPKRRLFSWEGTGNAIHDASLRAFDLSERTARWGWRSQKRRVLRWQSRLFMIVQISLAAGMSWWLAQTLFSHKAPFLAVVATIVCLGFSFGQRLWRALEISVGVTVGVLFGDIFLHYFGTGVWQIVLVIAVAMSFTTWLGARTLMVTQSAVQAAVVLTVIPGVDAGISRWMDALVGCGVALVFATVAPTGPVMRPRLQAAKVLHETANTIREMILAVEASDMEAAERVLASARATEQALATLTTAANEGAAVVRFSPFMRRHRQGVLQIADLTVPLDRFTRNLRVLARRAVVAVYRGEGVPDDHLQLMACLAQITDECAAELFAMRQPSSKIDDIVALAEQSATIPVGDRLSSAVILAQARSMMADLLELCGMDYTDARDSIPDLA